MNNIKIFGGTAHTNLVEGICERLGLVQGQLICTQFSDGENRIVVEESTRNKDVFIVQPTCAPVNDTLMELCIMADAFKRSSSGSITAIIPYFGYARQDKKATPREPITAKMVCDFFKVSGIQRIMTIDIHSEQIQGFFDGPFDNLYAGPLFADFFKENGIYGDRYVVVSPDVSGGSRAQNLAKHLDCDFAVIKKHRPTPNVVVSDQLIGDVNGKISIIVDDMVDTAGSVIAASDLLKVNGAKCAYLAFTHAILSGRGSDKIQNCDFIEKIVCTDTIPINSQKVSKLDNKLSIISVADLLSESIKRQNDGDSISSLFSNWKQ